MMLRMMMQKVLAISMKAERKTPAAALRKLNDFSILRTYFVGYALNLCTPKGVLNILCTLCAYFGP